MDATSTPVNFRALNDIVWLEPELPPDRTASGLYIVPAAGYGDDGKKAPLFARVVAVGPGRRLSDGSRVPPGVKVGDRVLVGAYEGHLIEHEGRSLRAVYEIAIHGIVEEEDLAGLYQGVPRPRGAA